MVVRCYIFLPSSSVTVISMLVVKLSLPQHKYPSFYFNRKKWNVGYLNRWRINFVSLLCHFCFKTMTIRQFLLWLSMNLYKQNVSPRHHLFDTAGLSFEYFIGILSFKNKLYTTTSIHIFIYKTWWHDLNKTMIKWFAMNISCCY